VGRHQPKRHIHLFLLAQNTVKGQVLIDLHRSPLFLSPELANQLQCLLFSWQITSLFKSESFRFLNALLLLGRYRLSYTFREETQDRRVNFVGNVECRRLRNHGVKNIRSLFVRSRDVVGEAHVDHLQRRLLRLTTAEAFCGVEESWTVIVAFSKAGRAILGVKLITKTVSVVGRQVSCKFHF